MRLTKRAFAACVVFSFCPALSAQNVGGNLLRHFIRCRAR